MDERTQGALLLAVGGVALRLGLGVIPVDTTSIYGPLPPQEGGAVPSPSPTSSTARCMTNSARWRARGCG